MAEKLKNTIDKNSIKLACLGVNTNHVIRNTNITAVGNDTQEGRLFIQTHQIISTKTTLERNVALINLEEKKVYGLPTDDEIEEALRFYIYKSEDNLTGVKPILLAAPFVHINPDLTFKVDQNRVGLWKLYTEHHFDQMRVLQPGLVLSFVETSEDMIDSVLLERQSTARDMRRVFG